MEAPASKCGVKSFLTADYMYFIALKKEWVTYAPAAVVVKVPHAHKSQILYVSAQVHTECELCDRISLQTSTLTNYNQLILF